VELLWDQDMVVESGDFSPAAGVEVGLHEVWVHKFDFNAGRARHLQT
jgi:hypothetical protein